LLTTLLYGGMRLSEALRLEWSDVDLQQGYAYLRRTKNGEPQAVHLPPPAVAALANLEKRGNRVFRGLAKNGKLHDYLREATAKAGIVIPPGIAFHILRHSYAAWARRYGGADTSALVATGRWKSHESARIYEHVDVTEAAKVADLFPTRKGK
jgi:integrase